MLNREPGELFCEFRKGNDRTEIHDNTCRNALAKMKIKEIVITVRG